MLWKSGAITKVVKSGARVLAMAGFGVLAFGGLGCSPSRFLAHQMLRAPNRVPESVKPEGRVSLRWPEGMLERFPSGTNWVGHPGIPMRWVVMEPADYGLSLTTTNRRTGSRWVGDVDLRVRLPAAGLPPAKPARGTAFVLHGYGVDLESMVPWGLYLAEAGWRAVLVDWRGHGHSGGRQVTFGIRETNDVRELRLALEAGGRVQGPYVAVGHSMGAGLALRWQAVDPALRASVALGPYAAFVPAAERLRSEYARWLPSAWVRGAARRLPGLLGVTPEALDTVAALRGRGVAGYLVASADDRVTPPEDAAMLAGELDERSRLLVIDGESHETLPYAFRRHGAAVLRWLDENEAKGEARPK